MKPSRLSFAAPSALRGAADRRSSSPIKDCCAQKNNAAHPARRVPLPLHPQFFPAVNIKKPMLYTSASPHAADFRSPPLSFGRICPERSSRAHRSTPTRSDGRLPPAAILPSVSPKNPQQLGISLCQPHRVRN